MTKNVSISITMADEIRKVTQKDIVGLKEVLDSSGLFPSAYLDEMISDYLHNPESTDIWFTKIIDGRNVAIGYCALEKFTGRCGNKPELGSA